jgi:hypothetical protein
MDEVHHQQITSNIISAIHDKIEPISTESECIKRYPNYAVADKRVLEALLFYAPIGVHHIIDTIRIGHQRLTKKNMVSEFANIGINIPNGFDLTLLNDPVYQFCKTVQRLPHWRLPRVDDLCFAKSATANSMHDPAPYVACMLMGSQCRSWKNLGIGVAQGNHIVTGVGSVRLKNPGIVYNPLADRNRDSPNSWVRECKNLFDQSLALLHTKKQRAAAYSFGMTYACISQNKKAIQGSAKCNAKVSNSQISWGDHELWLEVMQVSEMAASLHTIKEGGDFLLKVRSFHAAALQFAVAALARHFKTMDIVPVPQQRCAFVVVHYTGKMELSAETLEMSTDYFLEKCADSSLDVFSPPECCKPSASAIAKVKQAALEMERYKDDSFHYFATATRALKKDINTKNAFIGAHDRISDVSKQISLTTMLRNAIHPHPNGAHNDTAVVWQQFLQDVG